MDNTSVATHEPYTSWSRMIVAVWWELYLVVDIKAIATVHHHLAQLTDKCCLWEIGWLPPDGFKTLLVYSHFSIHFKF